MDTLKTTSLIITQERRREGRRLLASALAAAKNYDGSDEATDRLIEKGDPFDAWVAQQRKDSALTREEAEQNLTGQLRGGNDGTARRKITISQLLELAFDSFQRKLTIGSVKLDIEHTPFILVPTDTAQGIIPGSGKGVDEPHFENRLNAIFVLLNREGISTDDIKIYDGTISQNAMRRRSYCLVQIPRLDREILVCDQVGEASFIGRGQRGPLFWATYRKEALEAQANISRLPHHSGWENRMLELLTSDNPIQPKIPKPKYGIFPLTEDIILVKALEYAATHNWQLPTQYTSEVEGLPGQKWSTWHSAINQRNRGLTLENCGGLNHLFERFGLKMGRKENKPLIMETYTRVSAGELHGLKDAAAFKLGENLILTKALEHAAVHNWKLPTEDSGPIEGFPGQSWRMWEQSIRHCSNGLTRENCKGLGHLFRIFGLKMGKKENELLIKEAYTRMSRGEPHGLIDGTPFKLDENLILIKALEYAAAHNWKLPTTESGEVEGLSGQNWRMWDKSIRDCGNGLSRENCRGLGHLFQLFGLKMGFCENITAIEEAYTRTYAGNRHGLRSGETFKLNENLVLVNALEYAAEHNWQLPSSESGDIKGLPGQKWNNWNLAVRHCSHNMTRANCRGLSHLFQIYGLKESARGNLISTIQTAYESYKATGHHGLTPSSPTTPIRNGDPSSSSSDVFALG